MATFVRIRRIHRMPLRIGSVNVSSAAAGSLVNVDDVAVKRDLRNNSTRYVFIDRYDSTRVAGNAAAVEANMSPWDCTGGTASLFGATTGGKELAAVINLPAGFTVTSVSFQATAVTGTSTHLWATIATYDGSANLTYQAVSPDTTSGTLSTTALTTLLPVVSAGVKYVTPFEGQYVVTLTHTAATTAATVATATFANLSIASQIVAPIPQNVASSYAGNPVTNALVNPWAASTSSNTVTTPPAVGATNVVATNFATAIATVPYIQVA